MRLNSLRKRRLKKIPAHAQSQEILVNMKFTKPALNYYFTEKSYSDASIPLAIQRIKSEQAKDKQQQFSKGDTAITLCRHHHFLSTALHTLNNSEVMEAQRSQRVMFIPFGNPPRLCGWLKSLLIQVRLGQTSMQRPSHLATILRSIKPA